MEEQDYQYPVDAWLRDLEQKEDLKWIESQLKSFSDSMMLEIVCAEKNIEGTYQVVEQLLQNVDSLCDFQKSRLFQHMKFKNLDSLFVKGIKEKLLDGFRDEESFGYMRGQEVWEKLIGGLGVIEPPISSPYIQRKIKEDVESPELC